MWSPVSLVLRPILLEWKPVLFAYPSVCGGEVVGIGVDSVPR